MRVPVDWSIPLPSLSFYKSHMLCLRVADTKELLPADGGDGIRAALVEVDSSASGKLPISALAEVFRLAAITLTLHQVISIHRRLSKSTGSLEISVGALLKSLDV